MTSDQERGEHAELVIAARRRLDLSQRDLARRVGVSPGAVGQLERGMTVLSEEATERLATALEVDQAGRLGLLRTRLDQAERLSMPSKGRGRRAAELAGRVETLEGELDGLRARLDRVETLLGVLDDAELEAEAGPDPARS